MIYLYQSYGASDFSIIQDSCAHDERSILFENTARLLIARSQRRAAEILRTVPFKVVQAWNDFGDEFQMLYAVVSLEEYEQLRNGKQDPTNQKAFEQIAAVLSELGTYIRMIVTELEMERLVDPVTKPDYGLKELEINKLVYKYIGVDGGYLGDFSYRSHHEFYTDLGLDINPYDYEGSTRIRFMKILSESEPQVQARILDGILKRFPENSSDLRTAERIAEIRGWIRRLRSGPNVEEPVLNITSEVVERALSDAQELLRTTGATSGVDRIHTGASWISTTSL
jgi:hypothetical protein